MKDKKLHILIVEDAPCDVKLMEQELHKAGLTFVSRSVATEESFLRELEEFEPDIILSDFLLPQFDGMTALRLTLERTPNTPFILVTGILSEEVAVNCLKAGAIDYVMKKHLVRLGPAVKEALDYKREREERQLAEQQLRESLEKLRRVMGEIIQAMALTVEAKDPYTSGHQRRVANLARMIALELDLSKDRIDGLCMAGSIHDLGKITIPGEILNKPGKLNKIEYEMIKLHPKISYDILKGIEFPWPVAQIIYQHHERLDGSGYPNGLKGDEILFEAKILAVADVIEAMSSHRPYRPALSIDKALEEISKNKEILYDPKVVDACLRLFFEKGYNLDNTE